VLEELRRLGIYDRATVLLTSDHGEGLGDHGEGEHGILLYRESLQVPLILKLPGNARSGETISQPVQLVDIPPTLLELAGVEPPERIEGVSLLDFLRGRSSEIPRRTIYAESYYPRLYFGWSELASLLDSRYHYIDSPEPELYDLLADPQERNNLIDSGVEDLARLVGELRAIDRKFVGPEEVDRETRRRLESLGYIGGTRTAVEGPLPAPASQVHLLQKLEEALRAAGRGDHDAAIAGFESILAENPRMVTAWDQMARSLRRTGRIPEALDAYRETLRVAGDAPHVALEAARLAAMLGRLEEARELAAAAVAWDPLATHLLLARAELAAGRPGRARSEGLEALAADPSSAEALVVLAQVELLRGAPAAGLETLRRAVELPGDEPVRSLHLVRGNLLVELDRIDEAVAAFQQETELFEQDPRAYGRLAMIYGWTDREELAVQTIRRLLATEPPLPAVAMSISTLRALGETAAAEEIYRSHRARMEDPSRLDRMLARPLQP